MARKIQDFKTFEEAEEAQLQASLNKTPQERILLLHKLIHAWMKFPRYRTESDDVPTLKRLMDAK